MAMMSIGAKILSTPTSGIDTVHTQYPISGNGSIQNPVGLSSAYTGLPDLPDNPSNLYLNTNLIGNIQWNIKPVRFDNSTGGMQHTVTDAEVSQGYFIEEIELRRNTSDSYINPYCTVLFEMFNIYRSEPSSTASSLISDIDLYYVYGWANEDYDEYEGTITNTDISNKKYKNFFMGSATSLAAGKVLRLRFKYNLTNQTAVNDKFLMKYRCTIISN